MTKITETKDLVPGILYCLMTHELDAEDREWDRDGALVYWTSDGDFMDEDGDVRYDDWDYAVPLSETPNPEYVWQ